MKYVLKQKLLSIGNDFAVLDEQGKQAFYFDGKVVLLGQKTIVKSPDGKELAVIRKKLGNFRPTFIVKKDNQEIARIFKKAFSFRTTFVIDVPGPDDITIRGQMFEHDYKFYKNGTEVAEVSKKWFKGSDTYGVDIQPGVDVLLILCGAVVIDSICHPKRDSGF